MTTSLHDGSIVVPIYSPLVAGTGLVTRIFTRRPQYPGRPGEAPYSYGGGERLCYVQYGWIIWGGWAYRALRRNLHHCDFLREIVGGVSK